MWFWALDSLTEVGKAKSDCAIDIEWSPDGTSVMTSVLYERVKVDNLINLFSGCGKKHLPEGHTFVELHSAYWQPSPPGTFQKPSIEKMQKEAEDVQQKKPKRVFAYGGGGRGGAFAQIMR